MRPDDWKTIFREKGWLQGNKVVPPAGSRTLFINFLDDRQFGHDQITAITDRYIETRRAGDSYWYLWKDLVSVRIMP
jgi:hypothetical protein